MSYSKAQVCARFSQVLWHDSKIIDLHLLKDPENYQYDLRLDVRLMTGFSQGKVEARKTALFSGCRIIKADLDLLGLLICGGAIGDASCHADVTDFEKKYRDKAQEFDFPDDQNPLEDCLCFLFELIPPGGELIVFAKDFQLI